MSAWELLWGVVQLWCSVVWCVAVVTWLVDAIINDRVADCLKSAVSGSFGCHEECWCR